MNYSEAVEWAKVYFQTPPASRFVSKRAAEVEKVRLLSDIFPILDDYEKIESGLLQSEGRMSYDLLKEMVARRVENGEELSEQLREWAAREFRNPSPPNRSAKRPGEVQHFIGRAVWELVKSGMNPTRGAMSAQDSACDAVAEALRELRLKPNSYEGVQDMWSAERALRGWQL